VYKESNVRSIFKGVSWRIVATLVTIIIVYLFFGRIDLAILAGIIESILKVLLYWIHERVWHKVRWGKKRIKPFNIWFTGLPLSGKTTIADAVYIELQKLDIPLERLDSKEVRKLIPNIGFTRDDRNQHMKRLGHLIQTLQNNSISTVASFVSPYFESRQIIKEMVENNIIIYIKADLQTCINRDHDGKYAKAFEGVYENFTGVSDVYEEPKNAELTIDTDTVSVEEASKIIVHYVKKNYVH